MPKEFELITCPNPECKEKIGELIIVSDVSTIPVERYYACPRCFFKLDVISAQFLRKEKMREHAEEKKGPSRCPHDFGYLASLPEDEPIPRKCLVCPKVLDCALKTNDF
ncbi:MAG: hypothetical protein OEV19_01170 [Candidatus Bathyarchaeota archaeon]|nr:hypothetical protein [Candidatus Bathyarchaeota archaeon]